MEGIEEMQVSESAKTIYAHYQHQGGVTTDSRKVKEGAIFFGLSGEHVNGGIYAQEVLNKGAALAVTDMEALASSPRVVVVPDVRRTLAEVAWLHRQTLRCPILGVTGTNGKTTTKELLRTVLATHYKVSATEGNFNNDIGVPLTLLAIPPDCEFAIIEMGANHPGEIATLCEIAEPTHGLITSVGAAHLEGFGSIEGVAKTKSELFAFLKEHDAVTFVREDDVQIANVATQLHLGCLAIPYSLTAYKMSTRPEADGTLSYSLEVNKRAYNGRTQLVGAFNAINILAALHVGYYFNVPIDEGIQAIAAYSPQLNRSQLVEGRRNKLVADCYNANPTSMRLAIDSFMEIPSPSHRLLILGEMKELGTLSVDAHRAIQEQVASFSGIEVWYVGKNWERREGALFFNDVTDCARHIALIHYANSLILLKGSHSVGLEQLIDAL